MEFVYVIPRDELFPEFYPHGLLPFGEHWAAADFVDRCRSCGFFVERDHAERTPSLQQVIPYSVVVRRGEILLIRRLRSGGESRLFDKLSIGIGGHINPEDVESASPAVNCPIEAGSERELREELEFHGTFTTRRVGILNDDSNPVGAVHVGLVQVVHVDGDVAIRETDVLEGRWVSPDELARLHEEGADFETWSALLIARLAEVFPEPAATAS